MALPVSYRLPLRFERDRLNSEGKNYYSSLFTVVKASSPDGVSLPRFGILLSKKTAALAVDRNRIKRLTSAAIQSLLPNISPADYLIIPKRAVLSTELPTLVSDLGSLLTR